MKNNSFDPEEINPGKDNQTEPEMMEFTAIIHDEQYNKSNKQKKHFNVKVFLRSLCITLLIALLIFAGWRIGAFATDYFSAKKSGMSSEEAFEFAWSGTVAFFTNIVEEVSPVMLSDKNVLIIGSDKSKINADVIMLVKLDSETKSVDLISILRDTKMTVNGRSYKLNASLQLGGEEFVVEQVEKLLNVDIDNYVFVNYEGFREVIDAIGGVDFYVPQDMYYVDPEQDLYINLKEGQQHLDGDKAEQLVRFRQYPMGDIQRTQVQRDFLMAVYKQKLNSNLLKSYKTLIPAVMNFVDTDVSATEALQYANFVKDFNPDAITSYQMPYKIIEGSPYVLADSEAIAEMFEQIEASHIEPVEGEVPYESEYRDTKVNEYGFDIE